MFRLTGNKLLNVRRPEEKLINPRTAVLTVFFLLLVSGVFVATLLLDSTREAQAADKAEFVVKFGTIAPDGTPWSEHLKRIKKRVEAESGGRIKMKLFFGGALGGEVEMVRSLRRGRLQGFGGTTAAIAEGAAIPQLQLLELPYLFDSLEEVDYVLDEVVEQDYKKILAEKGFFHAYWHENGWRSFATRKIEVHTPEDLSKLKMRSQESQVHLAMYRALGVQAESIPVPEVLGALQTGMVDGFDNTPLFASASGWYEGADYFVLSQHIYQPGIIAYSQKFMDTMPEDLQKILVGDVDEETLWGRSAVRAMREPLLQNFRDVGMKVYDFTPAEREAFRALLLPVHKQFEEIVGKELLEKGYAGKKAFAEQVEAEK